MIPGHVKAELESSERKSDLPYIDVEETKNQNNDQTAAKNDASNNCTNGILEGLADIELPCDIEFARDVLRILELKCKGNEAENVASYKR